MPPNIPKIKAVMVWSGGKDSTLALYKMQQDPIYEVIYLLTTVSKQYNRVSMHGVRTTLLEQQARALDLPLRQVLLSENPGMAEYEHEMTAAFTELKSLGVQAAVFGDIFLADLRAYCETQMAELGLAAVFPLWHAPTVALIEDFIHLKFKAMLVCLNAKYFTEAFAGREINKEFLVDLPPGVDPGGENGEYHSFVYDGPIFNAPISVTRGEIVCRNYAVAADKQAEDSTDRVPDPAFWFIDLR